MTQEWLMKSDKEKLRAAGVVVLWIVSAIVHQTISLIGIPVLSAFLIFTACSMAQGLSPVFSSHLASRLLTQTPGFPIQACLGLLLGFVLGRYSQRKVMLLVWVLPLVIFSFVLVIHPMNGSPAFGPFYLQEARHKATFLEQLSWLIVVIPSAAYALGAKLAKPRLIHVRSTKNEGRIS